MSPCSKSLVKGIELVTPPPLPPQAHQSSNSGGWHLRSGSGARQTGGGGNPRKESHVGIDFRIEHQTRAYKKDESPPKRVKPAPIIIIIFIIYKAFGDTRSEEEAIADMIFIAFLFLLRPGEYTGTLSNDVTFKLQDVDLYIQGCKLDLFTAAEADINSTTSVPYTFTTQKNGNRNKQLVQGLIGDPWCCPARATVRRVLSHQHNKASPMTPVASLYWVNQRTFVKAKDITEVLHNVMCINVHRTGIDASEISAR
jgi:hypothetical protein